MLKNVSLSRTYFKKDGLKKSIGIRGYDFCSLLKIVWNKIDRKHSHFKTAYQVLYVLYSSHLYKTVL